tara:strand:+ start:294 stop:629 length:336 start_codon:yes stop_codon:yes gene_type:complete
MPTYDLPVENNKTGNPTSYKITLDDEDYNIRYTYNRRIDTWFLSISNADDSIVLEELPILLGVNPMIQTFAYTELLPFGDIQLFDDPGDHVEASLENFGTDKTMIYESVVG